MSLNRVLNLLLYKPNIRVSSSYKVKELSSSSELKLVAKYYRSSIELIVI